MVAATIK